MLGKVVEEKLKLPAFTNIPACYDLARYVGVIGPHFGPTPRVPSGPLTPITPPTGPVPAAPSNVHIDSFYGVLMWTDNSNNEDGFHIYQNNSLVGTVPANATSYGGTLVLNCNDVLSVSAYNANGESTRMASSNKPSDLLPSCR